MNAGGVSKACKSNESMTARKSTSGKRVSNTLVTYPKDADNLSKEGLIRDGLGGLMLS